MQNTAFFSTGVMRMYSWRECCWRSVFFNGLLRAGKHLMTFLWRMNWFKQPSDTHLGTNRSLAFWFWKFAYVCNSTEKRKLTLQMQLRTRRWLKDLSFNKNVSSVRDPPSENQTGAFVVCFLFSFQYGLNYEFGTPSVFLFAQQPFKVG